MPDDDTDQVPDAPSTAALFAAPEPLEVESAEVVDDNVQMQLAAPWRIEAFRTPAMPGYQLTQQWQSFPPDVAQVLYDEATRCGFAVSSSGGHNEAKAEIA